MSVRPSLALALAVSAVSAVAARAVLADGALDKQYLARRNQVDEKAATGFLGLATCVGCTLAGIAEAAARVDKAKAAPGSSNDQRAILDRVNAYRKMVQVKTVELDAELSKGCQAHCGYLVENDGKPEVQGLKAH